MNKCLPIGLEFPKYNSPFIVIIYTLLTINYKERRNHYDLKNLFAFLLLTI